MVLPKNAADKLDGEKDKQKYWMNFKQDANSLPNLSKVKWLSLDMHAATIGVISSRHAFSEWCQGKEEGVGTSLEAWHKISCAAGAANVRTDDDN